MADKTTKDILKAVSDQAKALEGDRGTNQHLTSVQHVDKNVNLTEEERQQTAEPREELTPQTGNTAPQQGLTAPVNTSPAPEPVPPFDASVTPSELINTGASISPDTDIQPLGIEQGTSIFPETPNVVDEVRTPVSNNTAPSAQAPSTQPQENTDVNDSQTTQQQSLQPLYGQINAVEDGPLNLFLSTIDTNNLQSITLSNVPNTISFSTGVNNLDGTWSFSLEELQAATVTTPVDFAEDFTLTTILNYLAEDGTTQQVFGYIGVSVDAQADTPILEAFNSTTNINDPIPLTIVTGVTDTSGSESVVDIVIEGVPTGASLSAGIVNSDGTVTLLESELEGLTITPAAGDPSDIRLTVTVNNQDIDEDTGQITTNSKTGQLFVIVDGDATAPIVATAGASVEEDGVVQLSISTLNEARHARRPRRRCQRVY